MKQRHGRKYFVKAVKEEKDHSWRNKILHLIFEVSDDLVNNYICTYDSFQCIESGTKPDVSIPVLDHVPSVRPLVTKPEKSEAISHHQSRMIVQ